MALVAVSVGRVAELVPVLAPLGLGNVSLLLVLVALVLTPNHELGRLSDAKLTRPVLIFLALVGTSVLVSVWPGQSLEFIRTKLVINLLLFVGVVKALRNTGDLRKIAYVIILSATVFTMRGLASDWQGRVGFEWSMFDQNDLALFLCCVLPFMLAEASLAKQNWTKLLLIGASLCSVLMTVLTQSRGGFLSLLAVTVSIILFRGFRLDKKPASFRVRARRVLLLALATVFLVAVAPEEARERLLTITEISGDYNVSEEGGRIDVWTRGLNYLSGHPWGSGIGTFPMVDLRMGGKFQAAHNIFVQVAVEIGVIGLIVYLWCFKGAFGALRRVTRGLQSQKMAIRRTKTAVTLHAYSQALLLSMIAFCVAGFFLSVGYFYLLFLFFAMIAHVERLGKRYVSTTLRYSG